MSAVKKLGREAEEKAGSRGGEMRDQPHCWLEIEGDRANELAPCEARVAAQVFLNGEFDGGFAFILEDLWGMSMPETLVQAARSLALHQCIESS